MYICVFVDKMNHGWNSVESYFQAHKCCCKDDFYNIMEMNSFEAKKAGRNVQMRNDWHDIKLDVMLYAIRLKFIQNDLLKEKLLKTSDSELEEYAPWDKGGSYWGINADGIGENHTGKILMKVRGELALGEI